MGVDDKASQQDYNNHSETARGIVTVLWGKERLKADLKGSLAFFGLKKNSYSTVKITGV